MFDAAMTSLVKNVSIKKAVNSPAVFVLCQGCVPVTLIPVHITSWAHFNHLRRGKESDIVKFTRPEVT